MFVPIFHLLFFQEAFAIPTSNMTSDFDFQSSNKLFKKEAIFEEWRQKDGVNGNVRRGNPDKIRNTDMVLERSPPAAQCSFQVRLDCVNLSRKTVQKKRRLCFCVHIPVS